MAERIIPQRFLDAGEEPEQTLTPIKGYEKYPLVSLKESIEPIRSLLYDIDSMIETARRNCRKPKDSLTQDESASIHLYTMQWPHPHPSLFQLLNQILRSKNRNQLVSWFLYLKLFFTALFKLPSFKGIIYRGVSENLNDHYENEDQIWWGMSSCTETMNVIKTFLQTDKQRTIFNIECLHGKFIQSHSYFQDENEILLLPGTYFQIVSKMEAAKGLTIIHLREKIPPYVTLASPFDDNLPIIEKLTISNEKKTSSSIQSMNSSVSSKQHSSISINNKTSTKSKRETKFQQNGTILAGGNGKGNQLNQLYHPFGIFVDENKTIFIADYVNDRIVEWKCDEKQGQIIAGGNGEGERIDQLNYPSDVIVDQQNHSIIIADLLNSRVMRWSRDQKQQILIQNIECWGLTMDQHGFIYVSDYKKDEVRKWKLEKINENKEGILVAGGNGKGNQRNQLNWPSFIFVDKDQSLYVSDYSNHRVMKWRKDAKEGIVVAGGNGQGNNLNQLNHPQGLFVDEWNQIYVADLWNHRIMRWCEGDEEGEIVVGGNGEGSESNQLSCPYGLSFDLEGNLYVSDYLNHRIVRFDKIH